MGTLFGESAGFAQNIALAKVLDCSESTTKVKYFLPPPPPKKDDPLLMVSFLSFLYKETCEVYEHVENDTCF